MLLAAGSTGGVRFGSPEGYIYDLQGTKNSEVFNLMENWFSIQGRRSASVSGSSAFAGHFKPCSTKVFHCISGSLNLIVPKTIAAGRWVYGYTECVLLWFRRTSFLADARLETSKLATSSKPAAG